MQGDAAPEGLPGQEDRQAALGELRASACTLAQLYNDYASRFRLWALAIRAVDLAQHDDADFIAQLWDVALRQVRICMYVMSSKTMAISLTPCNSACAFIVQVL